MDNRTQKIHEAACSRGDNGYIDPQTGFFVLTAKYLSERGHCCGAGCRHCPYPPAEQRSAGRPTISGEEK
ncbi:MAG: DUF5522 domain-containing protein [Myxococcota bacterium]|nr:DUF5522 domain-containing protein [Myxococcota bacterium]